MLPQKISLNGGVCTYISDKLAYNDKPNLLDNHIEAIFVDILLPKTKPILVGTCYRPPNDNNFYSNLETMLLQNVNFHEQEIFILGDFNTDVNSTRGSSLCKSLMSWMKSMDLHQLIKDATQITANSSTVLDLIITSEQDKISQSGVLDYQISDHCPIFCTRKVPKYKFNCHIFVKLRSLKNYDVDEFRKHLREVNWFEVINCENIDSCWSSFKSLFMQVVDKVAPVKEVRLKQGSEHWFNSNILSKIQKRDVAFNAYKKTKSAVKYKEFCKLRNKVQSDIKNAKKEYVKDHVNENRYSIKKLWSSLKELGMLGKVQSNNVNSGLKKEDNVTVFDKGFITHKFNTFFGNAASKLVEKMPCGFLFSKESINTFYESKNINPNSFHLNKVTEEEVFKQLSQLNVNKATGHDGLAARFLKDGAPAEICSPLTYIINLSFETSTVISDTKVAKVVPLFKKGHKANE